MNNKFKIGDLVLIVSESELAKVSNVIYMDSNREIYDVRCLDLTKQISNLYLGSELELKNHLKDFL